MKVEKSRKVLQQDAEFAKKIEKLRAEVYVYLPADAPRREWFERDWARKGRVRHWGQRKLFLSELFFLTHYGHLSENVVYAGGAPGLHVPYLSRLFPRHRFTLIDPTAFGIPSSERITLRNAFFTNEMCAEFVARFGGDYLFISDIRTANSRTMDWQQHEECVERDNRDQVAWVQLLRPRKAMLKFRCLHTYEQYRDGSTQMFAGDLYVQPWAPRSSTESRLICDADSPLVPYENLKYGEQFFYHNDVVRIEKTFKNPVPKQRLQNNFDSVSEVIQLYDYLTKHGHCFKPKLSLDLRVDFLGLDIAKNIRKYITHKPGEHAGDPAEDNELDDVGRHSGTVAKPSLEY